MTLQIAVVDDQALVRDGLARIIRAQPDMTLVGVGQNGRDAVDFTRRLALDVVVMDIRMPLLDGIEATRAILSSPSTSGSPKILIMTTFALDEYVYESLRAGASGFLVKDGTPEEFLAGIRTVARGEALLSPAVTRTLIGAHAHRIRPPAAESDRHHLLTSREREVLGLLAAGKSNAEIAETMFVTRETVKTYVTRVLAKLEVRDRVQAVVYAFRAGLTDD
jgi:DNA-binding NarL/FixJ family response regulator